MSNSSTPLINFLRLFRLIPPRDAEIITAATELRQFHQGDELLREGKVCREIFFICKGVLRIVNQNEKGDGITHFFLKENQFCSIQDSFNNGTPAKESILASCDAEVITLERNKLKALYTQLPYLENLIDNILQQALLERIAIVSVCLKKDATTRYRNFLSNQPDVALRVPLSDVASYLGITQQSLSRIRKNIRS
ncbi:Crp/Fnr family transcriptional regulator [Chitinophaga niastensis]|nr:Crp/Fnr family transcriptional regulator [Chitinophaga niastensis]